MQTAHALSSLKQAHRIMTIISMHTITVMITVTVTAIINITMVMAMTRRMLMMMDTIIVIANQIVTLFDLVDYRSTRYLNTGLSK